MRTLIRRIIHEISEKRILQGIWVRRQIFFFYKRHNSDQMLNSNFYDTSNMFQTLENPTVAYTLPIPSVETNY